MEMFIGKQVLVTVAFGCGLVQAGSVPEKLVGTFEKDNGDFIILSNVKCERNGFTGPSYAEYGNSVVISKKYVIMMTEK